MTAAKAHAVAVLLAVVLAGNLGTAFAVNAEQPVPGISFEKNEALESNNSAVEPGYCDFEDLSGMPIEDVTFEWFGSERVIRILTPSSHVSKEFNPRRINIHIDLNGRVIKLECW